MEAAAGPGIRGRARSALSGLTGEQVAEAVVKAGLHSIEPVTAGKLADYANLLIRWNARTNLTAISDPADVLDRHLVECIAAAQVIPNEIHTLLDYGSGAGLPGIPIALCRPDLRVTLAESQSKKVAFLREALRVLRLDAEIFGGRVEDLGGKFDVVCMRAVDKMADALEVAVHCVTKDGVLALFVTDATEGVFLSKLSGVGVSEPDSSLQRIALPSAGRLLFVRSRMFHAEQ